MILIILLFSQVQINTAAIILLLLWNLYFVSNFKVRMKKMFSPANSTTQFLNTQAKIKAIDYAPTAIITIDIEGNVVSWAGAASKLFGYKEQEIMGKPLDLIVPEKYREKHNQSLFKAKETGNSPLDGKTVRLEGLRKDSTIFPMKLTLWKWKDENHIYFTGIIRDITGEQSLEERVEEALDMYAKAEDIDDSGVWSWDVLNDKVVVTRGFERLFDIDRNEVNSVYLLKRVYHEDIKAVEAAIKDAFINKKDYKIQYRIVTRDGSHVKVEINAKVYLDKHGEVNNITGTIRKI